jgi:PelA/Pel-15E family pectate lyase
MILRLLLSALLLLLPGLAAAQPRDETLRTMRRATQYMVEHVATEGGYVWSYLPDRSRRWGEIEAYPSMIWVQPPGTATMGHLFLDAFHATGDPYYWRAAEAAAGALIRGQHRSGGWNYFIDFAGPASTRRWYSTIGRNAWRMEEFQHYSDNATFDDAGTAEAMQLMLRMYFERREARYRAPLDRAIAFVLDSQYPNGGWPQRWPAVRGYPAYADYITFNDDVAAENIRFLLMVYRSLGEARVKPAILRAMEVFLVTHQPMPQPGWSLQHTLDLKPAGARSYEPLSLATHTTAANVRHLLNFYRMTADPRFLARVPETLDWLETLRLPPDPARRGRDFPTFIELGSDRALYVHRRGSNVVNGAYYWDYTPEAVLGHYGAFRAIDIPRLRRDYERLRAAPRERLLRDSPLAAPGQEPLARLFVAEVDPGSDLNASPAASAAEAVRTLNEEGWWPTPLRATSNPYRGPGPRRPPPGDYRSLHVGDSSDTSPYTTDRPVIGISTATYIANMALLIRALERPNPSASE